MSCQKNFFEKAKKSGYFPKNGLIIALGRLVKLLEKKIVRQEKKSGYFPKMVLELL